MKLFRLGNFGLGRISHRFFDPVVQYTELRSRDLVGLALKGEQVSVDSVRLKIIANAPRL